MKNPTWDESTDIIADEKVPTWDESTDIVATHKTPKDYFETYVVDQFPQLGATIGGLVGGTLGSAAGGFGAIPAGLGGAGVGGYLGKAAQNLYDQNFRPKEAPAENLDYITEPIVAGAQGVSDEMGGMVGGHLMGKALAPVAKSKAAQAFADWMGEKSKSIAERLGARSLGAERGTIKKLGVDKIREAGRYGLDEGLITPFASADDMIARNNTVQERAGKAMGDVYKQIDDAGASTFNPLNVASKIDEEVGGFWRSPINRGETNQLENTLESVLMRGGENGSNISLREAQTLKQELGKVANWKNNINITDKERMAREAYGIVSSSIDEATEAGANAIGAEGLKESLQNAKSLFGKSKTAEDLLTNKFAREQGNKLIGLTDNIAGAGAAASNVASGGVTGAVAGTIAAKKALERYGTNIGSLGADKIGDILKSAPQAFGKFSGVLQNAAQRGPTALGATHFILETTNPEYQKTARQLREEEDEDQMP